MGALLGTGLWEDEMFDRACLSVLGMKRGSFAAKALPVESVVHVRAHRHRVAGGIVRAACCPAVARPHAPVTS